MSVTMAFDFTGKKILVTGASSGIGLGLALALSQAGAEVYALDKDKERLDALKKEDASIHIINNDLADWDTTRATLEKLDVMDGLVNNAAVVCEWISALDHDKDSFNKLMPINMMAPVNVAQVIAKKMIRAGKRGSIVNVSSITAERFVYGLLPYGMAKAAIDMMTKHFAVELGPHNIRVNSVNPFSVKTPLAAEWLEEGDHALEVRKVTPLGRLQEISEVVQPIMYLLSDASSMVTGTQHVIDGGMYCIGLQG